MSAKARLLIINAMPNIKNAINVLCIHSFSSLSESRYQSEFVFDLVTGHTAQAKSSI